MRVPYKYVLGLLLFNVVFALTTPIFNTGYGDNAVDINDPSVSQYNLANMNLGTFVGFIFANAFALMSAGIIVGLATFISIATKNYVYIGAGIFLGIVIGMYVGFIDLINTLVMGATQNNPYVMGLVSLLGIALGVVIMFNVVDMFAPSPTQ